MNKDTTGGKEQQEKAPERGKWVMRSTYQAVCEENKKLKADIYTLVMLDPENEECLNRWLDVNHKWQEKFKKDAELCRLLQEMAVHYFKENPHKLVQPNTKDNG